MNTALTHTARNGQVSNLDETNLDNLKKDLAAWRDRHPQRAITENELQDVA